MICTFYRHQVPSPAVSVLSTVYARAPACVHIILKREVHNYVYAWQRLIVQCLDWTGIQVIDVFKTLKTWQQLRITHK